MNGLFEQIISDFHERALPRPTPREAVLPRLPGKIDTLIGMRRTGKSWRLYQAMNELVTGGTPKESPLYVNFDDERIYPLAATGLALAAAAGVARPAVGMERRGAAIIGPSRQARRPSFDCASQLTCQALIPIARSTFPPG